MGMSYISSVSSTTYSPISTSGSITFSGLGNGTDFDEIREAQVEAQSVQLETYEADLEETEYIVDLLEELQEEFEALEDTLSEYDDPDEFIEMGVTTTDDDAVSVEATGEAREGSYELEINQLARYDVWATTGYTYDSTDTVITTTDTQLTFTYGDETIAVDVAAGTTLQGLVDSINRDSDASEAVEASLLSDGDEYYFFLSGQDTGADNTITLTDTGTIDGFDLSNFENTQEACNAQIKVDGFPPGEDTWLERDSNEIDDVIDGVEVNLRDTTDGSTLTINVEYDEDAIKEKIYDFVEEVNQIILDIQTLTGRLEDAANVESGDDADEAADDDDADDVTYTVDNYVTDFIYDSIKNVLSTQGIGTYYDYDSGVGDYYNSLAMLGFYTDTDEGSDTFGQLQDDEDTLDAALDDDPGAVARLFCASGEATTYSDDLKVTSWVDSLTEGGAYDVSYTVSGGVITEAYIDGEAATIDGTTLFASSSDSGSQGLYLQATNLSDGDHSGTVYVKQGKVGEMIDVISELSAGDGVLATQIEYYEESVSSLEDSIYSEELRLDNLNTRLKEKYSALDSMLSYYTNMQSMIASLTST
jgi:flagellar hook-associated protein 2